MKKIVLGLVACLWIGTATGQEKNDTGWDSNWFLSVKGGVSAFVGTPVGHGDLFDREKPMLNLSVGKWITPYWGGRIAYQGMRLIDASMESRPYQNVHADVLYNILGGYDKHSRWDIVPYLGCGVFRNGYTHQKPFAVSYGIIGRYQVSERLHLTGEIGNTTTWQDFDGQGVSNKLGDHLLQASIGVSVTIGRVGFSKGRARECANEYDVTAPTPDPSPTWEGSGCAEGGKTLVHQRNDYSGLNSLRNRLANKQWDGMDALDSIAVSGDSVNSSDANGDGDYLQEITTKKNYIGAPIYFFFKIGTTILTEPAQSINIKEVASIIKKYRLNAHIIGAADSQTGTVDGNEQLSKERADYIARLLIDQGVPASKIHTQHRGGIDTYEPLTGNRNTCIRLYFNTNN